MRNFEILETLKFENKNDLLVYPVLLDISAANQYHHYYVIIIIITSIRTVMISEFVNFLIFCYLLGVLRSLTKYIKVGLLK